MNACIIEGCVNAYRARGYCASHYNQILKPDRHRKVEVPCTWCGKPCMKELSSRKPFCSYQCRDSWAHEDSRSHKQLVVHLSPHVIKPRPAPPQVILPVEATSRTPRFIVRWCEWCGEQFIQDVRVTGAAMRFCTAAHTRAHGRAAHRVSVGRFVVSDKRRFAIYQRDRYTCQICGGLVNMDLAQTDRMSPTLDHIECQSWTLVPDHSDANLRLAHRACNSARRDRAA